jgi:hypothetical protein
VFGRIFLLVSIVSLSFLSSSNGSAGLKAGVARVDLTPPLEMKASLGGYGERMSKPAEGIHDRVFAKALVLEDGDGKFAIVTADTLGFPPPVKVAVLEKLSGEGWTKENVLLLASHAHTSHDMTAINPKNQLNIPQLGIYQPQVYELVVNGLVEVIREAAKELVPIEFDSNSTLLEGWAANRRRGGTERDEVLTVARIDGESGEPLAVLVNWAAHPTFMDSADMMYSAGWPGHLQRTLEALIDEGVTVLYYNGAQGDQRPVARPESGSSRWEKAERYGRELAIVAYEVWKKLEPKPVGGYESTYSSIELPPRIAHRDFMQTGGAEYGMNEDVMAILLEQLVPAESMTQSIRVGDLVLVGIPGELASGLGKEVKKSVQAATGAADVTIAGLANEWISYMLSEEEYEKGGYEASVSFYGPKLGPTIMAAAVSEAGKL